MLWYILLWMHVCFCCVCYPHMPLGKMWIYRLLVVYLFVCTVTDFSAEDKASCVKFCTVFCRHPGQGISHLWELCSPRSPKSDESASARGMPGHTEPNVNISDVKFTLAMCHLWNIARRADLGSTYYVSHH